MSATVLGPLVAGLLLARRPTWRCRAYAVDAVLFTVALWATLRLPPMPPEPDADRRRRPAGRGLRGIVDGLALSWPPRRCCCCRSRSTSIAMVLAMPRALFPEVAAERFGGGRDRLAVRARSPSARCWPGSPRAGSAGCAGRAWRWSWPWSAGAWRSPPPAWPDRCGWRCCCSPSAARPTWSARSTGRRSCRPTRRTRLQGRMQGVFIAVVAGGPRLGDLRAGATAALARRRRWPGSAAACAAAVASVASLALLRRPPFPAASLTVHASAGQVGNRLGSPAGTERWVDGMAGDSPSGEQWTIAGWPRGRRGRGRRWAAGATGSAGCDVVDGYGERRAVPRRRRPGARALAEPDPGRPLHLRRASRTSSPLTEPARHNAIHGLVNWVRWRAWSSGRRRGDGGVRAAAAAGVPVVAAAAYHVDGRPGRAAGRA